MTVTEVWKKTYVVLISFLLYLLPVAILFVFNIHMYIMLRRSCQLQNTNKSSRDITRKQRQVANNIASLVCIFFICHLPYRTLGLWLTFVNPKLIMKLGNYRLLVLIYTSRIFFYLNHAINPLIYNFVSSKFRNAICVLLSGCRPCHSSAEISKTNIDMHTSVKYTYRAQTSLPMAISQV